MLALGAWLRESRKEVKMSQEAMAEEIHIARSTISKLERDEMSLSAEDLLRWLQIIKARIQPDITVTALEVSTAIVSGVDIIALTDMLTKVVGGCIYLLRGGF